LYAHAISLVSGMGGAAAVADTVCMCREFGLCESESESESESANATAPAASTGWCAEFIPSTSAVSAGRSVFSPPLVFLA
jgi:hypothetical protein